MTWKSVNVISRFPLFVQKVSLKKNVHYLKILITKNGNNEKNGYNDFTRRLTDSLLNHKKIWQ